MPHNTEATDSPFFHRNYGGYTQLQKEFYESILKPIEGLSILDPMGGQGYYLSEIARKQAKVWLGDINPAPLLLACLRDPSLIQFRDDVRSYMNEKLKSFSVQNNRENLKSTYIDDWIALPIKQDIEKYSELFGTKKFGNLTQKEGFWTSDPLLRFAACLPILAARELTCFHVSDNKTWLKPGKLLRETNVFNPLKQALDNWYEYACNIADQVKNKNLLWGELNVSYMNVEQGNFNCSPSPDAIISSPPYANRLDYTRMWYPEMLIASILFNLDINLIKVQQIGSNVVRNKPLLNQEMKLLPREIQSSLEQIHADDSSKASGTYYYPFFSNYAISLEKALSSLAIKLKSEGSLIIYIRDTVRKDILFPTGKLVKIVLMEKYGFTLVKEEKHIIRNHIGLLRPRGSRQSLYGNAQQEWWLAFRKGISYESTLQE